MTDKKKTACRAGTPTSGKDNKDMAADAVCGQYTTQNRNNQQVLGRRLSQWLAWVAGGSKRDKQGKPVLPKTEKQKEAKIA